MPNRPLRLQLAIQGGGAKICALLAAAECVEDFSNNKKIEVTRLAGTSAGAIVACLLAAEIPMGEVRKRLENLGKTGLQKLFPARRRLGMYRRFLLGIPFWDTKPLQELLAEFFDKNGLKVLGDIREKTGKQVFITAADITNERRVDYYGDREPIVNSLILSCSLPFVFSTFKNCSSNAIVDGGICENLPIDVLKEEEEKWGAVIGISLSSSMVRSSPRNLKEFALSLLNTSINNSMMRARESIGAKRVFQIVTNIDTLEFERALGEGLREHYDLTKLRAEKFFTTLEMVRQPNGDKGLLVGDPWGGDNVETMKKMGRIYRVQHEPNSFNYEKVSLITHANCLFPKGHPQYDLPDLIEQIIEFRPHDKPVYCHRLIVGSKTATEFPGRLSCIVRNNQGEEHRSEVVPSLTEDSKLLDEVPKIVREALIFFDPPLPVGEDAAAPYTITMRDCLRHSMSDLEDETKEYVDYMGTTVSRAATPAKRIDLVLFVPKDYPRIEMVDDGVHAGRRMNEAELAGYYVPHGFRALGWTGRNVPPGVLLKVKFQRLSGR